MPVVNDVAKVHNKMSEKNEVKDLIVQDNVIPKTENKKDDSKIQPAINKCKVCNKKTGLIKFNCRCDPDASFCPHHRYPEQHKCTYDYFGENKKQLEKNNPLVVSNKIIKI